MVQGAWYRSLEGTNEMNNKDIIFVHIMAYRRLDWNPLPEGWLVGAVKYPLK